MNLPPIPTHVLNASIALHDRALYSALLDLVAETVEQGKPHVACRRASALLVEIEEQAVALAEGRAIRA